ncbi:MAG: hypothetical protein WCR97_04385 [Bacilli bacterium]
MDSDLLEPVTAFKQKFKDKCKLETEKYFNDLVKTSKVDVELNRTTVKKYNVKVANMNKVGKIVKRNKVLRGFLIFFIVASFIASLVFFLNVNNSFLGLTQPIIIVIGILTLLLGVGLILLIVLLVNKTIKNNSAIYNKLNEEAEALKSLGYSQLESLCNLFDWGMDTDICNKTNPSIVIDKYFDNKKMDYLQGKYGFNGCANMDHSTLGVISGSIVGNPFLVLKDLVFSWAQKVYTGSIVITWTTMETDSKGHLHSVSHTQTLTASVTKPCANYQTETYLIYGNDAAPDLHFSRVPTNINNMSDKEINKAIKNDAENLEEKERKSISSGKYFTKMSNDEFEVLFNATNRDNEQEFRLLFTALAQQNIIKILRSREPFGDDFTFVKDGPINKIESKHAQEVNFACSPEYFKSFDYDDVYARFSTHCNAFFQSLYFDLAPLLSIPLYQMNKPKEYIYKKSYPSNYTSYEHEVMANSFDVKLLNNKEAKTMAILKTNIIQKDGGYDRVLVTAHSYKTEILTEFITKVGGDGLPHSIPVNWVHYIPVTNQVPMEMKCSNTTRNGVIENKKNEDYNILINNLQQNGGVSFRKGVISFLLANGNDVSKEVLETIDKYIK